MLNVSSGFERSFHFNFSHILYSFENTGNGFETRSVLSMRIGNHFSAVLKEEGSNAKGLWVLQLCKEITEANSISVV